jgi:hypothetical protein
VHATPVDEGAAGIRIQLSGEQWLTELQQTLRATHRMRHVEAMGLLRDSGALAMAGPDFLIAFGSLMARLAPIEPQIGRRLLVMLVEEWLPSVSQNGRRLVLLIAFVGLVRIGQAELAAGALLALCQAGYAGHAKDVLLQCPQEYVRLDWHLRLYNRVLPLLPEAGRLQLWSRFIRISAAPRSSLEDAVQLAFTHIVDALRTELVGRFVEEALLGSRKRSGRLIGLLRDGGSSPDAASARVVTVLHSQDFRDYAQRRAHRWSQRGKEHPIFDMWIARTLAPLVPKVPVIRLIALLGHAFHEDVESRVPRRFRQPTPSDQIVALVLIEACSTESDAPVLRDDGERVRFVRLLVPDTEAATAAYETLRTLSDRFLRACRVAAMVPLGGGVLDLDSQATVRDFFRVKSTVVYELRKVLERTYFSGATRVDQVAK